ncbi:MAG: 4-(cytidine 5'-diphospho)-2-C-methyl-D-erythritol kinase [Coriobacteriia bacterium]|nr:4-(cytidine 5'-diphospho)-2-C-methyl-D-erythritol kinase [Coriobacteriia bacterium]
MTEEHKAYGAWQEQIDMVAFAREATLRDQASTYAGSIKLIAPAKVNLYLGIGAKRADGYHDALNIMHALMLHDVLYMRTRPQADLLVGPDAALAGNESASVANADLDIRMVCVGCEGVEAPDIPAQDNLVYKAVKALAQRTGKGAGECLEVRLEKHIPAQAGLGGGSSDAAAALVGAAHLWGLSAEDPALAEVAASLGADVPFFLHGGCARFTGKGEVFQTQLEAANNAVVLVKPEAGLSTAAVYKTFDDQGISLADAPQAQAEAATAAAQVPRYNNLNGPARSLLPQLDAVFAWAAQQPAVTEALLCGSGSAVALFCTSFEEACRLSAAGMAQGWWTRTTSLSKLRAAVVPR